MTDPADPVHWLLPPDPDRTSAFRDWPAPARHRLALCALLDRIEELSPTGAGIRVVVADAMGSPWTGLGGLLRSYGSQAQVSGPADRVAEQVEMPADEAGAREGRHGTAMLGPADTPVRHLGVTVAGTPDATPWAGPWTVVTDEGWRVELSPEALLEPVLGLRPGQRLQAMVTSEAAPRVVSAWR